MAIRENEVAALLRWEHLEMLQAEYADFNYFLEAVMTGLMGFRTSDIQKDIGEYLTHGPQYSMIQAQRGQAKTTITAAYAVWCLIHDPSARILIVSSGGTMAKEISGWVIQIINGMEELECMRPDRNAGDRASVEAFDIHYTLKGAEKSPSVACVGITSNLQGKRADLLIADDVESAKNAATEIQRANLLHLTLDFTSICSKGKIVYLGTPQSIDSIYNGLPSRGYSVRIWPGRYPTKEQETNYGTALAPLLKARMAMDPTLREGGGPLADQGKAVDSVILDEDTLNKKEIDQGAAYFQLQHMLNTKLSDAERFPIKINKIMFMDIPDNRAPVVFDHLADPNLVIHPPAGQELTDLMYRIAGYTGEFVNFQDCHMYIDPAGGGQNGDETGWAISKFIGGMIYLVDAGGIPGGSEDDKLDLLIDRMVHWKVLNCQIEQNFGYGMFAQMMRKRMLERKIKSCDIEDDYATGQKELRIISALEPVIGSRSLVMDEGIIERDWSTTEKYGMARRKTFSLLFQMSRITRDKGALVHDDRLDAVAGTVAYWTDQMDQDKEEAAKRASAKEWNDFIKNPLGNGRELIWRGKGNALPNAFDKFRR